MLYAHSLSDRPIDEWEPLDTHLKAVAARAADFAAPFGWSGAARAVGLLHDIGKCSAAFQNYIRGETVTGPDHSTAGAKQAVLSYPKHLAQILAYVIAGHHAGLADGETLKRRLSDTNVVPEPVGWDRETGRLPQALELATRTPKTITEHGFKLAFLIRMLFSCLVDADFLETERFYGAVARGGHTDLAELRDRLRAFMAETARTAPVTAVNTLRAEILDHAVGKATMVPGVFTLTVPTGGGKTLASLSFALEHAVRHGLRRVVYVIPFTSIIEQTAQIFRAALGSGDDVLEHHASFDWEQAAGSGDAEGRDGLLKLRRAAENWDVPIVVTTAVQFFESLFAARTSSCRKLHNLADSVIVLDEAQTLPRNLLRPSVAALRELAGNYGASLVLCTATQPALLARDGFRHGFDIDADRELAPDPQRLYAALKRVTLEHRATPTSDAEIAERFSEQPQMLCIVNTRAHAAALFGAIAGMVGAVHLSTLMCPLHRRAVLTEVRDRLRRGLAVRLVSTSLIEAGVDVDFPEVWRAATGLDQLAQAAGRCNREGRLPSGRVVVFKPANGQMPHAMCQLWQAAKEVLRHHGADPFGLAAVRAYFQHLYWAKGDAGLDAAKLDGKDYAILHEIKVRGPDLGFPFASIARAFRLIEEQMVPVVVPWRTDAEDRDAEALLARIAAMDRPLIGDLRRLQQYTVSIPRPVRAEWVARGVLRPLHVGLGEDVLCFGDLAHYRDATGLDIASTAERDVWSNMIG